MPEPDPLKWLPPNASPRADAMWKRSPMARFYDLVRLTPEKADEYTLLLFESFSEEELTAAVHRMIDIRPLVRKRAMLEEPFIGHLAKSIIRAHWPMIDVRLRRPGYLLHLLSSSNPAKHAILNTAEGRRWLNWTCFELNGLLAYYARPKGYVPMPPPPGTNPLTPIPQEALEAGRQA